MTTNFQSEIRKLLNQKRMSYKWGDCQKNSDLLANEYGGTSEEIAIIRSDGGIGTGHYIYITPDKKYVIDAVIANHPEYRKRAKSIGKWVIYDYDKYSKEFRA